MLVRESLRMRPDRLVVGECRGEEVRELLLRSTPGTTGSRNAARQRSGRRARADGGARRARRDGRHGTRASGGQRVHDRASSGARIRRPSADRLRGPVRPRVGPPRMEEVQPW
ncbi:ATPase, T2SS/T4P/T4SS family [Microbacterium sp.]|uniref:ATPase, T2SS/T4P/T4SS family n=1 Tax=Microbacterium sp. TaxID=51671 RepID=UPI003A90B354